MDASTLVFAGGISLIGGALAFVGVFGWLAAKFSYPQILDGSADEVLPRLRAGGARLRAIWAIYSLLPLLLVIGAFGAYAALRYLGNYLGEFLGELCLGGFFLLSGFALRAEWDFPRWLSICGVLFSLLFIAGAFRNVTPRVRRIAALNNYLLPAWMIVLGGAILWYRLP
jgi:hypothetical protein